MPFWLQAGCPSLLMACPCRCTQIPPACPGKSTACLLLLPSQKDSSRPVACFLSLSQSCQPGRGCWGQTMGVPHRGRLLYCSSQPGKVIASERAALSSPGRGKEFSHLSQCPWLSFPDAPGDLGLPRGKLGKDSGENEMLAGEPWHFLWWTEKPVNSLLGVVRI